VSFIIKFCLRQTVLLIPYQNQLGADILEKNFRQNRTVVCKMPLGRID
jgi:hypothetical protein